MLRIGEINYLNCAPLFSTLRKKYPDSSYSFVTGHPSDLNAKLRNAEIDICPSSSIEYARNPELYFILPDLSISSTGPVRSVLLFSKSPIEHLDGSSIALTGESETSVILLKILLTLKYSYSNSYQRIEATEKDPLSTFDAMLLIGDNALKGVETGLGCHVYDLGELWHQFTGLPFVFALWLLRKDSYSKAPEEVYQLHERLLTSKLEAINCFAEIAPTLEQNIWTNPALLINYWSIISYDLTGKHLEGLNLYYRYAFECGFIESPPIPQQLKRGV